MLKDNLPRIILIVLIFISSVIFIWLYFFSGKASTQTLGASRQIQKPSPVIKPMITSTATKNIIASVGISPSPASTPGPSPRPSPNKQSYVIAAFGDSMVDTMGENLDYLDKSLMTRYPTTKFKFYNYGIGSQNVIEASNRFSGPFSYQTRNYPPIDQINADIIIISSFAYNPLSPYDKKLYLSILKEVIDKAKNTGAKVYLLVEIAPIREGFGKGVGGVNWDEEKVKAHVGYIFQNLDGAVNLASQTKTSLINAYEKSQTDGKYGDRIYVGSHDGIHPSIEGEVFMAEVIAETLKLP